MCSRMLSGVWLGKPSEMRLWYAAPGDLSPKVDFKNPKLNVRKGMGGRRPRVSPRWGSGSGAGWFDKNHECGMMELSVGKSPAS